MIEFHPVSLDDREWIENALENCGQRSCQYHFATLYAWYHSYDVGVAQVCGMFTECIRDDGKLTFLYPVGRGDRAEAIRQLRDYAGAHGLPLELAAVTPEDQWELDSLFPGRFVCTPHRDGFDYLYTVDQLAALTGRHYSGKRNHINRFLAENEGNWQFVPVTPERIPECRAMAEKWYVLSDENRPEEAGSLSDERTALMKCLDRFEQLGLEGGLLRVNGAAVAFTLGGALYRGADTFDVMFEKALVSCEGAFPMVNREFARQIAARHPQIAYLNREDDMGVPGLRQAKLSYRPAAMVEKQYARMCAGQTP